MSEVSGVPIVNPAYDDDIATEAESKNTGANNNANGSKTDQTVTSADVKVVIPEVPGDSPQVGCATNSTNVNITANETKWPNGKEPAPNKLIEPRMTFSERCARKKCLIIATAVIVIAILVFVTLLAYFLYPRSMHPTPTDQSLAAEQKDAGFELSLNGSSGSEGIVVAHFNGQLLNLCVHSWSINSAHVLCRQLGHQEAVPVMLKEPDDRNRNSLHILRAPNCVGNERNLAECPQKMSVRLVSRCVGSILFVECKTDSRADSSKSAPSATSRSTSARSSTLLSTSLSTVTTSADYHITDVTTTQVATSTTTSSQLSTTTQPPTTTTALSVSSDATVSILFGKMSNEGLVVVTMNGTNYTVCDDFWRQEEAAVVCRMNGFLQVLEYNDHFLLDSEDDYNGAMFEIFPSKVVCEGNETDLSQCSYEAHHSVCFHTEHVKVVCGARPTTSTATATTSTTATTTSTTATTTSTTATTTTSLENQAIKEIADGDIRLNPGEHRGRLEYYWDGKWGAVCNEGWDSSDALVACRQLGYSNVTGHSLTEFTVEGPTPDYVVSQMSCNGSEQRLADCSHLDDEQDDCYDAYAFWSDAGSRIFIECDPLSKVNSSAYTSDVDDVIRLVHGLNDSNVGMLQYKKDGQWGSLCNEGWTLRSAVVACTQLGFPGVQIYNLSVSEILGLQNSDYTSTFHGKTYQCNSIDEEIADCSHFGFATDCQHKQDEVALVCEPMTTETSTETSVNVTKDDTVRLVGGTSSRDGRVEMSVNGTWGRVCNNDGDWTHTDMAFVCYGLFGTTNFTAQFSDSLQSLSGNGSFVGGDFSCNATAAYLPKLNECQYNSSSTYLSECSDDALVKCL